MLKRLSIILLALVIFTGCPSGKWNWIKDVVQRELARRAVNTLVELPDAVLAQIENPDAVTKEVLEALGDAARKLKDNPSSINLRYVLGVWEQRAQPLLINHSNSKVRFLAKAAALVLGQISVPQGSMESVMKAEGVKLELSEQAVKDLEKAVREAKK